MKFMSVSSYSEYRNIIKGRKLFNNSFLPNDIKKYILQNRLFFGFSGNLLLLLYDEVKYFQLVCEGIDDKDSTDYIDSSFSKPAVCHIVDNNKNSLVTNFLKILPQSGFKLRCAIHEYVRDSLVDLSVIDSTGFIIQNNIENLSECHDILTLWQNNLPIYEVTYMTPRDIQMLADKNQLIILKDHSTGRLAGACYYDIFLGTTTIHHIVIDPFFRGKGCAGIILTAWIEQAKQCGAKVAKSWIEDTNISSQKCFAKVGFKKTSNISYQFIK